MLKLFCFYCCLIINCNQNPHLTILDNKLHFNIIFLFSLGTMKKMANGKPHRLTIQNVKLLAVVCGNDPPSKTQITKENGHHLLSITLTTRLINIALIFDVLNTVCVNDIPLLIERT